MKEAEQAEAILVDANLVMWAHHRHFEHHQPAHDWWAATLSNTSVVGVPWPTVLAFVRISTHPRALVRPLDISTAYSVAEGWLARPNVTTPGPTDRHTEILGRMLRSANASGNHTTDAHLAALALEWGLQLVSADSDFARYPDLRWHDPSAAW